MLSVVVVGRNDGHGYNLHKRVATSLNSIADPMEAMDEIIFIDWNTPDKLPTLIDSIYDTLTTKTKAHIRVLRVRTDTHNSLKGSSNKPILEPIARNVGIRRARNDWILSTNTDMVFNTKGKRYTEILNQLKPGLYHLYRFEIPEYIWDQFDRMNPKATIEKIDSIFGNSSLTKKISSEPVEGYGNFFPDAVGDFQLASKNLWQSVNGFPEEMLQGWHVDSRLSIAIEKMNKINSKILSSQIMEGFHQNHLRELTHFHTTVSMNSIEQIMLHYDNKASWGLSDVNLEEGILPRVNGLPFSSNHTLKKPEILSTLLLDLKYDAELVRIFLLDDLINSRNSLNIYVSSYDNDFTQKLLTLATTLGISLIITDFNNADKNSNSPIDAYILDFGISDNLEFLNSSGRFNLNLYDVIKSNFDIITKLKNQEKIITIRGNHWSTRSLIQENCFTPLQNNYTGILSGNVRPRKRFHRYRVLYRFRNFVRLNVFMTVLIYSQAALNSNREFKRYQKKLFASHKLLSWFFTVYKKLPLNFRKFIKSSLRVS
jgi:hypothetical protein